MEATNIESRIDDAAHIESTGIRWRKAFGLLLVAIAALGLGCASYRGTATSAQPSVVAREGQWTMVQNFPYVPQANQSDCGAAALAAVLRYWGHPATPQSIEAAIGADDNRLKAGDMEAYARSVGMRSYVFFGTMKDVVHELEQGRPVIVGLGKMVEEKKALSHYQVVVGWEPNKKQVLLLDPARGWQVDSLEGFGKEWAISRGVTMVAFPNDRTSEGALSTESVPRAASAPPPTALASVTDAQRYAAKEATSPDAKKYRGGDYIVISASALAVVLLVVLILILI